MRKLGLIGGMSWVSTQIYYETINRIVQRETNKSASAPLLIESLDFRPLCGLTEESEWDNAAVQLCDSAQRLEQAGAGALIIAANSMHRVYDRVVEAVSVPVIHIADCVGERMAQDGVTSAALIGTSNVMTETFYRDRLVERGIDLLPPDMDNVERLNQIIYGELMVGKATRDSQRELKTIFTRKEQEGARAIVLACTELQMIVAVDANILPIYDSARLHCEAASAWQLGTEN